MCRLGLAATSILGVVLTPTIHAEDAPSSHEFSRLTASIRQAVEEAPLEGACLLVVRDGQTITEQCIGRYTPDTVVAIASASKWLSAATIMTLVAEGKLSLDDPVSKFRSKFTGREGQITIRQLISHTSSLPGQAPVLRDFRITLADLPTDFTRSDPAYPELEPRSRVESS